MTSERTEQPTQRRRQEARQRGQVAVSREVDSAVVLLAAFLALRLGGPRIWHGLEALLRDSIAQMGQDPLTVSLTEQLGPALMWRALSLLLPLFGVVAALGALTGVAQSGGVFSMQAIKPQFSRMNPLRGLQRTFASKQAAVTLAKTLLKFVVIGGVAVLTLRGRIEEVVSLGVATSIPQATGTLLDIGTDLVVRVLAVLLALAALDFVFQRYELLGQLRMTRQEVKDELRQSEGDPAVKSRIARIRRSFLARIMQAVPQADVVLTNPTHYAVALKYDPATSSAPKVIAKGERLLAQRIRELAMEHGIPVIQNPPLTRAIYRAVPVGREITPDLYEAVAAVLAFVYRLRYPRARAVA
jgi:flagellar biosynthetic protein FlhB